MRHPPGACPRGGTEERVWLGLCDRGAAELSTGCGSCVRVSYTLHGITQELSSRPWESSWCLSQGASWRQAGKEGVRLTMWLPFCTCEKIIRVRLQMHTDFSVEVLEVWRGFEGGIYRIKMMLQTMTTDNMGMKTEEGKLEELPKLLCQHLTM